MAIYAIGDIHGQIGRLRAAHDLVAADQARHGPGPVIHLGDLVDRGPDSRGVVQMLMDGIARGEDWVVLKGNHDRMFTRFVEDPAAQDPGLRPDLSWLHPALGGGATLASYGVRAPADRPVRDVHADARAAVPPDHLAFLAERPTWRLHDGVFYVHAGVRRGVPLDAQAEDDLVWIRGAFLTDRESYGPLILHGHTVVDLPTHYGNRVAIDTGAGYGHDLTAVAVEGRDIHILTPRGRVALPPPGT